MSSVMPVASPFTLCCYPQKSILITGIAQSILLFLFIVSSLTFPSKTIMRLFPVALLGFFVTSWTGSSAFTLVMMGSRRGKGGLKKSLDPASSGDKFTPPKQSPMNALNNGRGQEITGVTLPADGTIKGWEFGNKVCMVCANVKGKLYALQGDCPRCAFDLWKGDLIVDDPAWDDLPRVACPTCATTFSLRSGARGPPIKRTGIAGFVGGLAKTATLNDEFKDAKAFIITREEDGSVYCKER